jgi:peptidoglycan/LPS O-acetylase OafA/YrhL
MPDRLDIYAPRNYSWRLGSLVACSFALFTCYALSRSALLNRLKIPGTASLALWSYAVYLVHKPVFMALRPELERWDVDRSACLTIVAIRGLGITGGWIIYRLVFGKTSERTMNI